MWGIFGFSSAAGLVFLTLLPAIRRGPEYVRDNGSPWGWPLYPWTLFGLLALAVPARAFLLCWSMHLVNQGQLLFAPFFLVPFGLVAAILVMEIGLVSRLRAVHLVALALPAVMAVLAAAGQRADPINERFLDMFVSRLGGTPLFVTMGAAVAFYGYAALRGVSQAVPALTAALVAWAFVSPASQNLGQLVAPGAAPLLAAAALQLGLGLWGRISWNCLTGSLLALWALVVLAGGEGAVLRGPGAFHLVVAVLLLVGAAFDDLLAQILRNLGASLVLLACLASLIVWFEVPGRLPSLALGVYPLVMAAVIACYGYLLRHTLSFMVAGLVLTCWLAAAGWQGYLYLKQLVIGLDYIALSLAVFAVAVTISLGKSGSRWRWLGMRRDRGPSLLE